MCIEMSLTCHSSHSKINLEVVLWSLTVSGGSSRQHVPEGETLDAQAADGFELVVVGERGEWKSFTTF